MASYTLMNETTPVLDFAYDLETHAVTKVGTVHNAAAAPLGLFDEHGQVTRRDIDYWWRHRAIPSSREQIDHLLRNLDLDTTLELPVDFCYTAKPFKREGMRPYEQLKLFAGHLGWLDPAALDGFDDEVAAVLGSNPNMGPARLDAIVAQVRRNMEALSALARQG